MGKFPCRKSTDERLQTALSTASVDTTIGVATFNRLRNESCRVLASLLSSHAVPKYSTAIK
jgi:uncharacterized protein (DUF4213/DUF364 family)